MTYAIKPLILASVVAGLSIMLSACASSGSNIDYSDDVETPDVLLEDASGGDSEYGLDKNAARNNQQNKPDGLESTTNSSSVRADSSPNESRNANHTESRSDNRADTQVKQERQPKVERQVVKVKPVKKTKPKKPKKQPSRQESALEADDPLLGEIDPR